MVDSLLCIVNCYILGSASVSFLLNNSSIWSNFLDIMGYSMLSPRSHSLDYVGYFIEYIDKYG